VKWLRTITEIFFFHSLFTVLCAVVLFMATEAWVLSPFQPQWRLIYLFLAGCTLSVYNLPYAVFPQKAKVFSHIGIRLVQRLHGLFTVLGIVLAFISVTSVPMSITPIGLLCGAIALAYCLPVLPFRRMRSLRNNGILKIVCLSLTWTAITGVMPIWYHQGDASDYVAALCMRFALIFAICLLYDRRDVATDVGQRIYTLPYLLGLQGTQRLILLVAVVLPIVSYLQWPTPLGCIGGIVTGMLLLGVSAYLGKQKNGIVFMLLADGLMLVHSLITIISIIDY